jgi:type VI secretion system protein
VKPRLLKRIRSWEEAGMVSAADFDVIEIMESLCDDLEKLLNTRRGTVLVDLDYGLPDFTHLKNSYAVPDVDEIGHSLVQQVRKYETRLESINLEYQQPDKGSGSIRFVLNAMFKHKKQDLNFVANIQLNDDSSVNVSL